MLKLIFQALVLNKILTNYINNLNLKIMSNLINFKNSIINDNGASYNLLTGQFNPDNGYMVSMQDHESITVFNTESVQYEICRYVRAKAELLMAGISDTNFLGGWLVEGYLYLDISMHELDLNEALRIAKNNNQLAIFDCKNKVSIYL